jgi:hypothetical protein
LFHFVQCLHGCSLMITKNMMMAGSQILKVLFHFVQDSHAWWLMIAKKWWWLDHKYSNVLWFWLCWNLQRTYRVAALLFTLWSCPSYHVNGHPKVKVCCTIFV